MKKLLLAMLVALPMAAKADVVVVDADHIGRPRPIMGALPVAQNLAQNLAQVAQAAQQVAMQAQHNGNLVRSRRFFDLAYVAGNLSRDVRQDIVQPLRRGEPLRRVDRNLEQLRPDFRNLQQSVQVIVQMPAGIEQDLREVRMAHQRLEMLLGGHR